MLKPFSQNPKGVVDISAVYILYRSGEQLLRVQSPPTIHYVIYTSGEDSLRSSTLLFVVIEVTGLQ